MPRHKESRSPETHEREARRASAEAFDRTLRALTPHTPATYLALAVSCAIFLLMSVGSSGGGLAQPFDDETLAAWGANQPALTADRQGWRLFAAIFIPFWLLQLLFNGWTLLDLGRLMERVLGSAGFLLVYVTAGFAGNLAHVIGEPGRLVAGNTGAV
ncbi:MAG TPA: rhomboid family intramembrane serine protease, partial [Pirellulales bacterium]|nr:rhomboid family intramembrane serine protease [Pirellulales bacterium]